MNFNDLKYKIENCSKKYFSEVQSLRRHFHQNPELSFAEVETAGYIMLKLSERGIYFKKGFANNGIVAEVEGTGNFMGSKRIIALRADVDGLPITEENDVIYKSVKPGIMHACGHDFHMASLLGTAFILNDLRDTFAGKVKFVFQPAEEKIPGGAKQMIQQGALLPDEPDIMLAQHVYPQLNSGSIGIKPGIYMASTDEIFITVSGTGGHAATPDEVTDSVSIAAQIIVILQQLVSRFAPPIMPTVLSFGKFIANGSTNIIPSSVNIEGTFRTLDENWRAEAKRRIEKIAVSVANALGAKCEVRIVDGYPVLKNDEKVAESVVKFASEYIGKENVHELDIRMTAEDFAYFAGKYPSVFYRIGTSVKDKICSPLHSSTFNVDESALETGMGVMAYLAVKFLMDSDNI